MNNSDACPHCRGDVEEISRNHMLNNMIDAWLDANPHLKRDPHDLKELDAQDELPAEALLARKQRNNRKIVVSSDEEGDERGSDAQSDRDSLFDDEDGDEDGDMMESDEDDDDDEDEEEWPQVEFKSKNAGLVFSVSAVDTLSKEVWELLDRSEKKDGPKGTLSEDALVFLTAVLEYLAVEIIEVSGNCMEKPYMTPEFLRRVIQRDEELLDCFYEDGDYEKDKQAGFLDVLLEVGDFGTPGRGPRDFSKVLFSGLNYLRLQVHPDLDRAFKGEEGRSGRKHIVTLLVHVLEKIIACIYRGSREGIVIERSQMRSGVNAALPGQLCVHAVGEGLKACTTASIQALSGRTKSNHTEWRDDEVAFLITSISDCIESRTDSAAVEAIEKMVKTGMEVLMKYGGGVFFDSDRFRKKRSQMVQGGILALAISVLDRYHDNRQYHIASLQKIICDIFSSLARNDEDRLKIMEAGGIERIIRYLDSWDAVTSPREHDFVHAVNALARLCENAACASRIVKAKGIQVSKTIYGSVFFGGGEINTRLY